jgi:hypothetical protein
MAKKTPPPSRLKCKKPMRFVLVKTGGQNSLLGLRRRRPAEIS